MAFPYISQIHINSCHTKQDFDVPKSPLNRFKHILITGKNGTGKTTILNCLGAQLNELKKGNSVEKTLDYLKRTLAANKSHPAAPQWLEQIEIMEMVNVKYLTEEDISVGNYSDFIFAYFRAHRKVKFRNVETVVKEETITKTIQDSNESENFSSLLKQYLVNRKVYEAFDYMNKRSDSISRSHVFFDSLTNTLKEILEDQHISLEFVQEDFEFYINLSDGRKITFNQLSEGFSAFFSIVIDLLIRVDHYRKEKNDYSIEPYGIVLIDEPETHFHLSLQYNILPLITKLFPNIQLVVATHSPAVISSINNAVVFDLSKMDEVSDWVLGSSYSELMISHFGLDNEFSPLVDDILKKVNKAVKDENTEELNNILAVNEKYLTPSLRLEIESQIINISSEI